MRPVASDNDTQKAESRAGTPQSARSPRLRKTRLRAMAMEALEPRTLLSTLPASTRPTSPAVNLPLVGAQQGTGTVLISNEQGSESTPTIVVDPNHPNYLAAVWTITNNPTLTNATVGTTQFVQAAYSTNAGASWVQLNVGNVKNDPTSTATPQATYAQESDGNVGFDRNDNLYILYSQHQAGNGLGEMLLTKYNMAGGAPNPVFSNRPVYQWSTDQPLNPTMEVDGNPASFSDGATNQSDPYSGNVYVGWTQIGTLPANVTNPINDLRVIASSDGGLNFSAPLRVPGSLSNTPNNNSGPGGLQLAVSAGSGANSSAAVTPGELALAWDQVFTVNTDVLRASQVTDGAVNVAYTAGPGPVNDAIPVTGQPDTTRLNPFPFNVNIADGRFTTLSNISVALNLTFAQLSGVRITLTPPPGSGLPPVNLINNQVDGSGTAVAPAQGVSGANLGTGTNIGNFGTTFDDNAVRAITNGSAAAPFVGHFRPEQSLLNAYAGATATQLNGPWTLNVTVIHNAGSAGRLNSATINFTSGMTLGNSSTIANTTVHGTLTESGFPTAATVTPQGIGPGLAIASDNTLGNFSEHQGRLYATFVNHTLGTFTPIPNPPDNTDINLAYSDDGGRSWVLSSSKVNDDQGTTDGFSESNGTILGRPQFEPRVAVDNANGTLVLSWFDARNDAARARAAVYTTTSTDGGSTFSPNTFVSPAQTATDAITGKTVVLGPIPENQSGGSADPTNGYGQHQGLAAYGGRIFAAWGSNLNANNEFILNGAQPTASGLQVRFGTATYSTGPRVVSPQMGLYNANPGPDGTPQVTSFTLGFDRPVDPATVQGALSVVYHDAVVGDTPVPMAVTSVTPANLGPLGATTFTVTLAPLSAGVLASTGGVGTYSYTVSTAVRDRFRTLTAAGAGTGNPLDQLDANAAAAVGQVAPTAFSTSPNTADVLPLIVPGPHVVGFQVPGASGPATTAANDLVLNGTVSQIDVTFDRDMNPASFNNGSVLRLYSPYGTVNGPFTYLGQVNARTYTFGFPTQTLSGTYSLVLNPTMTDTHGNALDTNQNAGLDVFNGTVTPGSTVKQVTYTAVGGKPLAVLSDGSVSASTINVPDTFLAQLNPVSGLGVTVQFDVTHQNDPDLQISLIPPPSLGLQPIVLVARGTGTSGSHADFSQTVFDDTAPTLIQNGGPPFYGRYKPQFPLNGLVGQQVNGAWTLQIDDQSGTGNGVGGSLNSWSISFQEGTPSSGLGEPVADQATVGFRIFTMGVTDPQSATAWTPIGPAPLGGLNGNNAGSMSTVSVDPSDPSGNTVYAGASSGGVWRTSNFLTTDAGGPTWVPMTDNAPVRGMNIGSISVLGRNNDPKQSIVIVGTGDGNASYNYGGNISGGVGFLVSVNGGSSWSLLDSTTNNGAFAARDHAFLGTSTMKVVVDPHLTPTGQAIFYAALRGPQGGLWRSVDTGQTWQKLSSAAQGNATDVSLDLQSATIDALTNPTGNVNTVYAAFPGSGVYISPNRGQVLNPMNSVGFTPLIVDTSIVNPRALSVNNVVNPTGQAGGRIVLSRPAVNPNWTVTQKLLYEGWLYAAVATPDGHLDGLYLTKDNGQNWVKLAIPSLPYGLTDQVVYPTNDTNQPNTDPLASHVFSQGAYDIALTVDPTNPMVVYLGGTTTGFANSGLIRIDTKGVADAHALVAYNPSRADGGASEPNTNGRLVPITATPATVYQPYVNLLQDPNNAFKTGSAYGRYKIGQSFSNDGSGVTWTPFLGPLNGSTGLHEMISVVDPVTGHARLLIADDNGVFSGVDNNGALDAGIGGTRTPVQSRNGNLQVAQLFYGAAQPSTALATTAGGLVYGNGFFVGQTTSSPSLLTNGTITSNGSTTGEVDGVGIGYGVGPDVNVPTQTDDYVYRFMFPALGGAYTNFFQVSINGGGFIGRTNGLLQTGNDPQWATGYTPYANGVEFGNFAVNTVNGNQVIISSNSGRIFSTNNAGQSWQAVGEPSALDGSYAPALAFGAPDPKAPNGIGNLNNFLYAGTVNGNVFVSQTGGGAIGLGNGWTPLPALDGSPVMKIVTDPVRGSHDAYVTTQKGVYYIADSLSPSASWVNITGNLFSINLAKPLGKPLYAQPALSYLTSLQADWRYVLPNSGTAGTHPVLYVSGNTGVYQSLDNGTTWALFPSLAVQGATPNVPASVLADGGYLPDVAVTDLTTSLGKIDPTTGRAVNAAGDPNILIATTFGRGQFAISLPPMVLPGTVSLDNSLPAPNGSQSGVDANNIPIVKVSQPVIDGLSEQTAFGNTVRITIYDVTSGTPVYVGGYNPALGSTNNPTDVAANYTDVSGRFQVQVSPTGFSTNGVKNLVVQATDASGAVGNLAPLTIDLQAKLGSQNAPTPPTLTLSPASDSSGGQGVTNVTNPVVVGSTDPNVKVVVTIVSFNGQPVGTALPAVTADVFGNYSVQLPNEASGVYVLQAVATNPSNSLSSTGASLTFTIKLNGPTSAPTLVLSPADDTGAAGDNITSNRLPHFVGHTDPFAKVYVYGSRNNVPIPPVLTSGQADGNGNFSVQLPTALNSGTITLQATVTDAAGNASPSPSIPLTVTIVTVAGDFTGAGKATPALFARNADGFATWVIKGVTDANGISYGSSTKDVPLTGDFDGDGISDKALYRPSIGMFIIDRSRAGGEFISLAKYATPGSLPVVGDFDGDGVTDVGLYDPASGVWTLAESTAGLKQVSIKSNAFAPQAGDIPVPGDYDGTGVSELAVFRASAGLFYIKSPGTTGAGLDNVTVVGLSTGTAGDVPVPGNYDDTATRHQTEPAVYNPTTAVWLVKGPGGTQSYQFRPGDIPAPGDYDGLGRTELAVYRPILNSFAVAGPSAFVPLGQAGNIPVLAPLQYRQVVTVSPSLVLTSPGVAGSNTTTARRPVFAGTTDPGAGVDLLDGSGHVVASTTADGGGSFRLQPTGPLVNGTYTYQARAHGLADSSGLLSPAVTVKLVTAQADYDGSGKTNPTLVRRTSPSQLQWFVLYDAAVNGRVFGTGSSSVPVVGDFFGAGYDQLMTFDPASGNWTVSSPAPGSPSVPYLKNYGSGNLYIPAAADYTGTGRDQATVYEVTTGRWYINGVAGPIPAITRYVAGDIPVPGDYDNLGHAELAQYRPGTHTFFISGPFGTHAVTVPGGNATDLPVPGNYFATAGNNSAEPALWRSSSGQFLIMTPSNTVATYAFAKGDIPAPGDYDGVGHAEPAVYRPSTAQFLVIGAKDTTPRVVAAIGGSNFLPVTAPYAYRAIAGTPGGFPAAKAVVSVSVPTVSPAAVATPAPVVVKPMLTPAPAPSPTNAKARPLQAVAQPKTMTSTLGLLKAHVAARKG